MQVRWRKRSGCLLCKRDSNRSHSPTIPWSGRDTHRQSILNQTSFKIHTVLSCPSGNVKMELIKALDCNKFLLGSPEDGMIYRRGG